MGDALKRFPVVRTITLRFGAAIPGRKHEHSASAFGRHGAQLPPRGRPQIHPRAMKMTRLTRFTAPRVPMKRFWLTGVVS